MPHTIPTRIFSPPKIIDLFTCTTRDIVLPASFTRFFMLKFGRFMFIFA